MDCSANVDTREQLSGGIVFTVYEKVIVLIGGRSGI